MSIRKILKISMVKSDNSISAFTAWPWGGRVIILRNVSYLSAIRRGLTSQKVWIFSFQLYKKPHNWSTVIRDNPQGILLAHSFCENSGHELEHLVKQRHCCLSRIQFYRPYSSRFLSAVRTIWRTYPKPLERFAVWGQNNDRISALGFFNTLCTYSL